MGDVFIIPLSLGKDTKKINDVVDEVITRTKIMAPEFIALKERFGLRYTVKMLTVLATREVYAWRVSLVPREIEWRS